MGKSWVSLQYLLYLSQVKLCGLEFPAKDVIEWWRESRNEAKLGTEVASFFENTGFLANIICKEF